jgi:hypothetical protein
VRGRQKHEYITFTPKQAMKAFWFASIRAGVSHEEVFVAGLKIFWLFKTAFGISEVVVCLGRSIPLRLEVLAPSGTDIIAKPCRAADCVKIW